MKTTPVTPADLAASVLAVPPLARHADLSLNEEANRRLARHMEAGGVTTLLYGGNANFYNVGVGEYAEVCAAIEAAAGEGTWVIPSVGPDYGKLMDQARVLRGTAFPTAMVLPLGFPATRDGIEAGVRRFADAFGRPAILYVKAERYLTPERVARLVEEGAIWAIKYAVAREDPARDDYLTELVGAIGAERIVSGMGERPAAAHLRRFGLAGFTSGSVCIAPRASMALLRAAKAGRWGEAEELRARFLPLEDLRDRHSPLRVLHEAVTLAGIADMGPILALLSNVEAEHKPAIERAARALLAGEEGIAAAA
ncbi:MAG TPA: dihydrodipicolinate synthase family protein [Geminicoccaceae bacterium]|nr:dihydrodipicolinate synthase family protein [Geminicoccaceae bacterium]